ncbi:MAG: PAS domain S-box protein [Chitinophagaceae bacterium]|nr:PAS domain S-box protein [Chitinophagaceae bacterium]MBP6478874.1 PAS domain S-box protein [Chitinophagaceae bacterium]MBP7109479.1 PAS domain S-box protein [Chitinophagaceae bacterium]MBP7316075.1 PAS domain S-box protein [Chitinophagaceae bacterium]HQX96462.1 PAS domain S-box protein [Chitinophagaceae bacterium]
MLIIITILAELLLVAGLIVWFYRLKPIFGLVPLFILIGSNQFFQTILATNVYIEIFGTYTISPGAVILFSSSLFTVLLIYIKEGVFLTQRFILGIIIANLTFTILAWLTNQQTLAMKGADLITSGPLHEFKSNIRIFFIGTIVLLFDTLIIVILYEYFFIKQKWLNLYTRLLLTMLLVLNFDAVIFTLGSFGDKPGLKNVVVGQLIAKSIAAIFFATILWIYLRYLDRDKKSLENDDLLTKEDIFSILTYRSKYERLKTEKAINDEQLQQAIDTKTKVLEQEIIARKLAELEMIHEKELSDSLINSLPGIFYLFNQQGKYFRWNKNFETVTGYNSVEIVDKHPLDFFEEEANVVADKIKNVFEVGEDNVSAKFVDRWGNKTPYFFTGKMINYEGERCLMGVGIDISERVKIEEELVKSEQSLRQVLSSITDIFYVINKNYQITLMNRTAKELLSKGWGKSVEVGRNILDIIPQNSSEPVEESFKKVFSGEAVEYEHFHSSEQIEGWFLVNYHPVINDNEQITGAYVVTKNITEGKIAKEQIIESNKQLRDLAAHLLSIREEERRRIGREIHDDLGQQLTAIKMDVAWIDKKIADETVPVKTKLKNIISLLDGSNQSVRRILNELKPSILDEYGLLDALEWHSKQFTDNTGIAVTIDTAESEIRLEEELATCIFRICQEALTNVARHAEAKKVLISLELDDDMIYVQIVDDGKGFDLATAQNKGSFGLLGMHERARSLNGTLKIDSSIKNGTTVVVSLPYKIQKINPLHE